MRTLLLNVTKRSNKCAYIDDLAPGAPEKERQIMEITNRL